MISLRNTLLLGALLAPSLAVPQNVYVLGPATDTTPRALNNDLTVVGGYGTGITGGFVWTPANGFNQIVGLNSFLDINELGVGSGTDGGGNGFRWTAGGGAVYLQPLPGYAHVTINGINNSNQVVGSCGPNAVMATTNQSIIIGPSPGLFASAIDVNSSGVAAGTTTYNDHIDAWTWSAAAGATILATSASGVAVNSINDSNMVAGSISTSAFTWTQASGIVMYPALRSIRALNNQGNGVGEFPGSEGAFIENGVPKPLSAMVGDGYRLLRPYDINDNDEIVGIGDTGGTNSSFMFIITNRVLSLPKLPRGVVPSVVTVQRGVLVSGGASDMQLNDGAQLNVRNGPVLSGSESPVTVLLDATSPYATVSELKFTMDAQASFVTLEQKVDLWDYIAGTWVSIDARQATTSDSVFSVTLSSPNRFIEPGTRAMRARVRFKPNGPVLNNTWQGRIDYLKWSMTE